jgi:phasin family protein
MSNNNNAKKASMNNNNNNNNMFQEAMNNWNSQWQNNNWADWGKNLSSMMDFNKVRQNMSRNMEAFTAANQVCLEGAQAISRRGAEMMQKNAQHTYDVLKDAMGSQNIQEAQHKQANLISQMTHGFGENMKEVAQIASKASIEVVEMMNKRLTESTHEFVNCCTPNTK